MIDFLGIGGQRCGTTWLYRHLNSLPDVQFPAGKEPHYWDDRRSVPVESWLRRFPDVGAPIKQGEMTPAYGILDRDTITELHEVAPDLRLFLSVRNPMERAWSAALMNLDRCKMEVAEASDQWFLDHFRSRNSRLRGEFSHSVDRWRDVFGTEQLHVIVFDDIMVDPRSVLAGVARHIGVGDAPFAHHQDQDLRAVVNPFDYGPVSDEVRERMALRPSLRHPLFDLYDGEVERLSTLLRRDLSHWLDWEGT
jgi:hypothetical protein